MKIEYDILKCVEDEIINLNLPENVIAKLLDVLAMYEYDILEYFHEQKSNDFYDIKYQEFKESKIF